MGFTSPITKMSGLTIKFLFLICVCILSNGIKVSVANSVDEEETLAVLKIAKITGGKPDEKDAHPWQALILTKELRPGTREPVISMCGGTLVHPSWVLTAGNCVSAKGKTKIFFGIYNKTNVLEGGRTEGIPIKKVFHKCYSKTAKLTGYNLLMLKLKRPELRHAPACINFPKEDWSKIKEDKKLSGCVATGYGVTSRGDTAQVLQAVKFSTVSHKSCKDAYHGYVNDFHICAYDETKTSEDTCKGDMGGPLVCPTAQARCNGYYLAGVTLGGSSKCGQVGQPGIYTAIQPHLKWINSVIDERPMESLFQGKICPQIKLKCGKECEFFFFRQFIFDPIVGKEEV